VVREGFAREGLDAGKFLGEGDEGVEAKLVVARRVEGEEEVACERGRERIKERDVCGECGEEEEVEEEEEKVEEVEVLEFALLMELMILVAVAVGVVVGVVVAVAVAVGAAVALEGRRTKVGDC
jgi:hypothetical protein